MEPREIAIAFAASLSLLGNLVLLFRFGWKNAESKARALALNACVALYAAAWSFMLLELAFATLFIQPDNFSFTLAGEAWIDRHWKPRNKLRYRDEDHRAEPGKKLLLVVGDSFVAGHGVADWRDRFSSVLAEKLGDGWQVANVARNGWNTNEEFAAIATYPRHPDAIILSYFLNDIEDAGERHGLKRPELVSPPPKILRPIVEGSYFFNFAYWRLRRSGFGPEMIAKYGAYRDELFARPDVWAEHERELRRIVEFARGEKIALGAVLFPDLTQVAATKPLTAKVAAFLSGEGVKTVDLALKFDGRDPKTMMVGPSDAHPNEATHREVGELLFAEIFDSKPETPPLLP